MTTTITSTIAWPTIDKIGPNIVVTSFLFDEIIIALYIYPKFELKVLRIGMTYHCSFLYKVFITPD